MLLYRRLGEALIVLYSRNLLMLRTSKRTRTANRTSKAPSIYDVAREAKVSVFTVSAVINDTGRVSTTLARRVEAAIRKLNYRPNLLARSLAKQQTHTLGMVVTDIANPFFPAIVRAAEDAAQKAGYSMLLCNSDDKADKEAVYLDLLISKRVDGIILNKTPARIHGCSTPDAGRGQSSDRLIDENLSGSENRSRPDQ